METPDSLISLAFGAAQALAAPVTIDMIKEQMGRVAPRVAGPEFDILNLPAQHMVDRPTEWARVFRAKLVEALDFYDVPPLRRAPAIGFALQKTIEAGRRTLDALIAARIVLQAQRAPLRC